PDARLPVRRVPSRTPAVLLGGVRPTGTGPWWVHRGRRRAAALPWRVAAALGPPGGGGRHPHTTGGAGAGHRTGRRTARAGRVPVVRAAGGAEPAGPAAVPAR